MDKRRIRDSIRLMAALLFIWLYIPHLMVYAIIGKKFYINSDLDRIRGQIHINLPWRWLILIYELHNNRWYRNVFYYRIGPGLAMIISWWRPGDSSFIIPYSTKIGKGMLFFHPFSTILNAESIGDNCSFAHNTTIGVSSNGRPIIGNNVSLCANVTLIGGIRVGNNVTIGAGAVVVKDVPDNAVVVGNPARILRIKEC